MMGKLLFAVYAIGFVILIAMSNLELSQVNNYGYLARAFGFGKTYFVDELPYIVDVAEWKDRQYWPLGPLPAMLLVPVSKFSNVIFWQRYEQWLLFAGTGYLAYWLARHFGRSRTDAWWLVASFCLGSIYLQVVMRSGDWVVAHVVGVFFGLWAVVMTFRKQWLLAGIGWALAAQARQLMLLGVIFSMIMAKKKGMDVIKLAAVVSASVVVSLAYNYVRFGEIRPSKQHELAYLKFVSVEERAGLTKNGIFNIKNIPTNFFTYFLKGLVPIVDKEYPGISFFVASPVFVYMFGVRKFGRVPLAAMLGIVPIVVLLLMYYWSGWDQVGPRYLLDAFPLFFVLLLEGLRGRKLSNFYKTLVVVSSILNAYLFLQLYF